MTNSQQNMRNQTLQIQGMTSKKCSKQMPADMTVDTWGSNTTISAHTVLWHMHTSVQMWPAHCSNNNLCHCINPTWQLCGHSAAQHRNAFGGIFQRFCVFHIILRLYYIFLKSETPLRFVLGGIWTQNLLIFGQTPKSSCLGACLYNTHYTRKAYSQYTCSRIFHR